MPSADAGRENADIIRPTINYEKAEYDKVKEQLVEQDDRFTTRMGLQHGGSIGDSVIK